MIQAAKNYTGGAFADEPSACQDLDRRLEHWKNYLRVYSEVEGDILHPRPSTPLKGVRIDRLAFATAALIKRGWAAGAIGIEIKKSNTDLGKVVMQCQDYTRSVFSTADNGSVLVMPTWVFIWPIDNAPLGDVASIMAQSRVGFIRPIGEFGMRFIAGPKCVISFPHKGDDVLASMPPCGNRVGSR